MDAITELLKLLSNMTPVAVIALFGVIILLLVKQGKMAGVTARTAGEIRDNHMHEIVAALGRIEITLGDVKDAVLWVKARTNGKS